MSVCQPAKTQTLTAPLLPGPAWESRPFRSSRWHAHALLCLSWKAGKQQANYKPQGAHRPSQRFRPQSPSSASANALYEAMKASAGAMAHAVRVAAFAWVRAAADKCLRRWSQASPHLALRCCAAQLAAVPQVGGMHILHGTSACQLQSRPQPTEQGGRTRPGCLLHACLQACWPPGACACPSEVRGISVQLKAIPHSSSSWRPCQTGSCAIHHRYQRFHAVSAVSLISSGHEV